MEAPKKKKKKKKKMIPVLYYLCRNRHIEHPHFIEVPLSSPQGLYLRDVINRLNLVRGKGMPAMYSWSCKRSYKNGFVWHDLSYDDLILPTNGDEYVLKGSELLDQPPSSDRIHQNNGNPIPKNPKQPPLQESPNFSRSKDASLTSSSPPTVVIRESKPPPLPPPSPREDEDDDEEEESSQEYGSLGSGECRVYKPIGSSDASTQTDDGDQRSDRHDKENENLATVASTDNGSMTLDSIKNNASRLSNGSRSETLESLIRADAGKKNSFRIHKEEEVIIPTGPKMKPGNILMQLITCGSIAMKDHESYGIVSTCQPIFARSRMLGELDCVSNDPRLMGLKLEDKEYFSGSFIETKKHQEDIGERMPGLKRSSSYNAERNGKLESGRHEEEIEDTSVARCLPRTVKRTSARQPKNEKITSISDGPRCSSVGPECNRAIGESSRSITDTSSVHGSSMRLESKEEKDKLIKIEERLTSGARVIIQSRIPSDDSEDGSGT